MGDFFNMDNKFFQVINKIVDCVALSVLWMLSCIPIFTIGAATSALYYAMNKAIRHGRGYVWSEYWHAFRINFKQGTLAWLLILLLTVVLGVDSYIMYQYAKQGDKLGGLYLLFIVLLALIHMWGIYIFAYIARFENGMKAVLKNAALISIANFPWTLLLFVVFAAALTLVYVLPMLLVIVPAAYMFGENMILERVFHKYMSEEDIAEEEERNRDFYN